MTLPEFLRSQKSLTGNALSLAVGLGLGSGLLLILQAWLLAITITAVVFEQARLVDVQIELFALLVLFLVRTVLNWSSELLAFKAAARVKHGLRKQLHRHLFARGPIAIGDETSGEMVTVLIDGIEALEGYYARYLPTMALVVLLPLAILVFVFPVDWISGLVLLLTAPLIPFFMILIGKGTERLNKKQWRKLARMSAHFLDMIQGLSTLKIFNASRREAEAIARVSNEYRQSTMSVLRVAFLSSLVLEFLASISIAIVAVLIGFRLYYGEIDFLHGFFVLLLAPEFYFPLRNLGTHYHARLEAIGAAEKMLDLLEKPLPESTPTPVALPSPHKAPGIRFEHVFFTYNNRGSALEDFNVTLPAGKRIALVGKSGAGKSTVLKLLARFISPTKGEILINEVPLSRIDRARWRQHITWLPQNPHLFQGSIRDNLTMGMDVSEEAIQRAVADAGLNDFIQRLPDGYETLIGEKGQGLSGGQIQRIALARAFLKDAPLILLDEATANLDAESEQRISQSIGRLARNKTLIMIAHRLRTVITADLILVIDKGRLIERGTHETLIRQSGRYAELVKTLNNQEYQ